MNKKYLDKDFVKWLANDEYVEEISKIDKDTIDELGVYALICIVGDDCDSRKIREVRYHSSKYMKGIYKKYEEEMLFTEKDAVLDDILSKINKKLDE